MPAIAGTAWLAALGATVGAGWVAALLAMVGLVVWRSPTRRWIALACATAALGAASLTALSLYRIHQTPVDSLAADHASVVVVGRIASDPRLTEGRFGASERYLLRIAALTSRGHGYRLATPVLVIGPTTGQGRPRLGAGVRMTGLLRPATDPSVAAVLMRRGEAEVINPPDVWWRGAERVRASLRESVSDRSPDAAALVPALVVGDDASVSPELSAAFRTTGLTHLLAVSGTNLTLLVGFLLLVARWAGVRGRGLYAVSVVGILGFLLLARAEPSVLRAAAMGAVGLIALGQRGRARGGRALGVGVLVLLLLDPLIARSLGFALSVTATAGIVYAAPPLIDALRCWLPRWVAEAVAVPTAAQLACTPLVAAISGQVSLAAIGANLAAGPAVGPATVLGLGAGLAGLLSEGLGHLIGRLAAAAASWIIWIAHTGAGLPHAWMGWSQGAWAIGVLAAASLAMLVVLPSLVRRRWLAVTLTILLVLAITVRPPTPQWPPSGWVMVACDVGQGDALVLNAGGHAAVVVDAGPDPAAIDRCLGRLQVSSVPLIVLSHFHADHVDGLSGVLSGRRTGAIAVTPLAVPADRARGVASGADASGAREAVVAAGAKLTVGEVRLEAVWPSWVPATTEDDGSGPNNASVVLLARVRGVTLLLCGDVEPLAQSALARQLTGLQVDVLKVPHHGSRYQDFDFLGGLGARVGVISVGAGNDYGHPADETLAALSAAGLQVRRTDQDGDIAIAVQDGRLVTITRDFEKLPVGHAYP